MSMRERVEDTEFSACARNEYGVRALAGHGAFSTSNRSGSIDSSGNGGICGGEGRPSSKGFLTICLLYDRTLAFVGAPCPSLASYASVPVSTRSEAALLAPEINSSFEF